MASFRESPILSIFSALRESLPKDRVRYKDVAGRLAAMITWITTVTTLLSQCEPWGYFAEWAINDRFRPYLGYHPDPDSLMEPARFGGVVGLVSVGVVFLLRKRFRWPVAIPILLLLACPICVSWMLREHGLVGAEYFIFPPNR